VLLQGYARHRWRAAAGGAGRHHALGADLLDMLTAVFNPLPAIALLPLALMWFGLGNGSLVFVLVHSVMWPMALNTHTGFRSVSPTLRMVGRNVGLRGLRYTAAILIPAAFPSILAGLKIGWAFAWRTLIAAELVFGVSSGSGGLGWFIYERKNQLDTGAVFAGLLTVILIGLVVEGVLFRWVETAPCAAGACRPIDPRPDHEPDDLHANAAPPEVREADPARGCRRLNGRVSRC
jgi:NitT/TauT family transport system permease protein